MYAIVSKRPSGLLLQHGVQFAFEWSTPVLTHAGKLLLLPAVKGNKLIISFSFAGESEFFQSQPVPLPASESVWLGCKLING